MARSKDLFAKIADNGMPLGKEQLAPSAPITYMKQYLQPSSLKAQPVKEISYEENLQGFSHELEALKKRYEVFLKDWTPKAESTRRALELKQFLFRYEAEGDQDFAEVLQGKGQWENVTVPDYRGPVGENGRWTAYYRTSFKFEASPGKRVYLVFKGVDYSVDVYLNGKCVGHHEGFFALFEFDVTNWLQKDNILVVEVKNDVPTLGAGGDSLLDGDKIYAATGPGWDDPQEGWHHCPPGAGIYNRVFLEERAPLFIQDIFVRPDIDSGCAEVWIDVVNTARGLVEDFDVCFSIYPDNFEGEISGNLSCKIPYAGPGINYYRYKISLSDFRLWTPDNPWLYTARVELQQGGELLDCRDRSFGMRKFHMDETQELKGTLYLNNRPILLRGANEMGHLQRCVMEEDFQQLVEDILIAKLANMNFYRITQRPVQEEIYDYCDRLGMMQQCDLPLFGYLRRNQFCEAVRQAGEMERLVRSHPSTIMVSLINEPMPIGKKGHRHLYRNEMEAFFKAARQAIAIENPDRVVKNAEGDYDPPTAEGLSDFHCYNMWYTNHAIPIGMLYKGFLPATRKGWKTGCGEHGTEGLDSFAVMKQYYPQQWLPENEAEEWIPTTIVRAQTFSMHGDWYEEQGHINDWIRKSQEHQAFATGLMMDALRRRSDLVISNAIHLLIDAWPSGWMKTLVGVDRIPKPAYFAYQKSLKPLRVNLRCDRWKAYSGETVEVEVWALNDCHEEFDGCSIVVTLRDEEREYGSWEISLDVAEVLPNYAGTVSALLPPVAERGFVFLDAVLLHPAKGIMDEERFSIEVFAKEKPAGVSKAAFLGEGAAQLLRTLGIEAEEYTSEQDQEPVPFDVIFISSPEAYRQYHDVVEEQVRKGARACLLSNAGQEMTWNIGDRIYRKSKVGEKYFAAANQENSLMKGFRDGDFSYFYNRGTDRIDFIADSVIEGEGVQPLLFTYERPSFFEMAAARKRRLPYAGVVPLGKGEFVLINLLLEGRVGLNPVLDRWLRILAGDEAEHR